MSSQRPSSSTWTPSALITVLVAGMVGCATSSEQVFPDPEWHYETAGLSPEVAGEVDLFVRTLETTGLMVVKGGKVIYEYGDVAEVSYIASVRKSVLSMLYGPYVADGTIHLDDTLADLGISDVGGLLPREERATVLDLITARSGVYHPACYDTGSFDQAPERGSQEPGSYWLYNNWDFNVAGTVFERTTGKNIYDALLEDLAIPLGMQDFDREQQQADERPDRSQHPQYTMWLSTRDMARLGYLMSRQGRWGERQLIPADWVRRSTSVVTPIRELHPEYMRSEPFGYGYMWWVRDGEFATGPYRGAYTAAGANGQWITVLPVLDMVVAHKTYWSSTGGPKREVRRSDYYRLLDLLTRYEPATTEELRRWKEATKAGGIDGDPTGSSRPE
ncbi:MAG: beta-lactamase family protein [Holophagales bacterium]|nr:beta-lactamase family protein [Holophagales bacterium]